MTGYSFTIDSDFDQVPELGSRVRESCEAMGVDSGDAIQVEICIVEAVNNVIEHGHRRQAGHTIEVSTRLDGSTLVTTVRDTGAAIPKHKLDEVEAEPDLSDVDALSDRGRGLAIMRAVMDDVSYASLNGRNTLTLSKHLASLQVRPT